MRNKLSVYVSFVVVFCSLFMGITHSIKADENNGDSADSSTSSRIGVSKSKVSKNNNSNDLNTSKPLKLYDLSLTFVVGGSTYANEIGERSQVAGMRINPDFKYHLLSNLDFKILTSVKLITGQTLYRFRDQNSENGISLNNATVNWQPTNFIDLHGGAISQDYLVSPLLIYKYYAFPGAKEDIVLICGTICVTAIAEQVIPTSYTFSTRTVDRETNPTFYAETLAAEARVSKSTKISGFGTLYTFDNLPSQVAYDSSISGNTVTTQPGPNSSQFYYDYSGFLIGAMAEFRTSPYLLFRAGSQLINNLEAAESYNLGQITKIESEIRYSDQFILSPEAIIFFNESDTSPAYYNSPQIGHNNMQGYGLQIGMDFIKSKFKIFGRYVDSTPININVNQARQQFFEITLETKNDIL